ncbi:substrate-binding domain-containing protein [Halomonas sp. ISL-60]|uniref:substrate-binding domain-containing protein n=1 Tax=Halomonas sp. ISL-56 TaxID=2819149 RepID=UPI001BE8A907|nr:substrate-binding domain-containing protein [Halomonas sp. ISL-56]MBT2770767.1 substrate-binding domain-containing protein [Halomonas sp. ISL-60]MBT2803869.1 substrate-binding domain-containing protein [Halomonas sp. ISL-56]
MNRILKTTVLAAAVMSVAGVAQARDQINIVGSSTVYPFSSFVAEEFGATTNNPTPVIESTGSGGGMRLFCNGVGTGTPDVTNSSRRMKVSEFERCVENGVTDITEVYIGSDGIAFAQSNENEPMPVTREQIFLAAADMVPVDGELVKNPYTNWNQIDASLPDREIVIVGPPTTSGTRDSFDELVMEAASESFPEYGEAYSDIRTDGGWVDGGENDNLIVQRLTQDTTAFGVFGYSFLEENDNVLIGSSIDGVDPTPETIASDEYPVARTMFFYIKNQHADEVPVMYEYAEMFVSDMMIGEGGLLKDIGLILPTADALEQVQSDLADRKQLAKEDLE